MSKLVKTIVMPLKHALHKIDLTRPGYLQTLVENRRIFNLKNCELNIFESYQQAWGVPLTFNDFVITSMVRGKKIMHLPDRSAFDYVPGETVIVPARETMVIDFPEAEVDSPTQCIALAVDQQLIDDTLDYLNSYYNNGPDEGHRWQLHFNQYHFDNDTEVSGLINKMIRLCSSDDMAKNVYADLTLKELLIRLVQGQQLGQVESAGDGNQRRLQFVVQYIRENLSEKILIDNLCRRVYLNRNAFFKWFKEQVGITPVEFINRQRIKYAKELLAGAECSISEAGAICGFSDVNYFVRLFRKTEGITPGMYKECLRSAVGH